MLLEICVKDFSGTAASTILKFGTNIGCDQLYCVKETQQPRTYNSLNLSILFLSKKCVIDISGPMTARVFKVGIHLQSPEG